MRRVLLIAAVTLGVLLLIAAALITYGALNLNSLVRNNRQYVLDRVGDSLGRNVAAQDVQVALGWGVSLEVSGLQIADDPAFSQRPFIEAKQMSGQIELLPLLSGQILVTRLDLIDPRVRIVRDRAGRLNVATLGAKNAAGAGPARASRVHAPNAIPIHFLVQTLTIHEGTVSYNDAAAARPIEADHLSLNVSDVNPTRPFLVKLQLAALGGSRNFSLSGKVGPLMQQGMLQPLEAPFSFDLIAGPILLDRLRGIPELRSRIPGKLSMPDPITLKMKIKGTLDAATFDLKSDLSAARLLYLGLFNKPAGTPFQISAVGFRRGAGVGVSNAAVKLAGLQAKISEVKFARGSWSAKIDTNRFELAPIAKMAAGLARYELSGSSEAHLTLASAAPMPRAYGIIAMTGVGLKVEGGKLPGISALTGTVRVDGNSAVLEPATFNLGSARAGLQGQASSLQPLRASYSFNADRFKLAELMPERPPDEEVLQMRANGTVAAANDSLTATTVLTSTQGMVSNVPYRNLALRAAYDGHEVKVASLTVDAYGGSIGSRAQAGLIAPRPFQVTANVNQVDLQQALSAQNSRAADVVRGMLSGQINASGKGSSFEEIKPTLAGNGRIQMTHGKLIGVNIVGSALKKIDGIPAIGTLFTPAIIARHPALFSSPDTDLKLVRMSYVMTGPRVASQDIMVQAEDYNVLGQGWFDMDKNVDLNLHVLMSRQFSSELQAEKKNVAYLEDPGGQIEIPLLIRGKLPHPSIQPDVQFLAQRAAARAMQQQGNRLLNRYLGNKGLGRFLGGGGAPSGKPSGGSNPVAPLENLFH